MKKAANPLLFTLSLMGKIFLWILVVLFIILALAFWPNLTSYFLLVATILILPIKKLQNVFNRILKRKLKVTIVFALTIVALVCIPQSENNNSDNLPPLSTSEPSETVLSTSAPTPTPTIKPTPTPTTKPTPTPTVKPTPTPTVKPTPTPTVKPTPTPEPEPEYDYVLNTKSMRFHETHCKSVDDMKESNKKFFTGTRDEVISMGYTPCGNCEP